ncbi:MAG: type 4a pilus biogenesis protein PilO [Candidatus Omnitrophica bacterium]|nr:type 4a pilus biogenesis protein PilO [Candidatus Omnitrophota bacterium]
MGLLSGIFKNIPELKMDEAKKKVLILYVLLLILIFASYFTFFLKPSMAKLFVLIPKARKLNNEIRLLKNELSYKNKFISKHDLLAGELGKYEKTLSREKEIPMLLENLSKKAKESGVRILGITPLGGELGHQGDMAQSKTGVYQEVPILISAQSGYHELGNFISRLENDERYVQVMDIDIKANRQHPKRHDINIVVYAYTFKSSS